MTAAETTTRETGSRGRTPAARTAASLALVEARLLARNVLVLAGLVAGGLVVARFVIGSAQPMWWAAGWGIGYGQQILGLAVLAAAQLAAGRPGRDGMHELYRSFPATASTRVLGQLAGLLGAVPASVVLIGAATVALELRGVVGHPDLAALAAGLLLVIAAGAIGIAVGSRLPHPLAGVVAAVALLVPFSQSNRFNDAFIWLFPWVAPNQLSWLPAPLAGYPPAAAHAIMLAGLAALAGLVALTLAAGRRLRTGLVVAAAVAVAVTGLAGAAQLRPIPAADLSRLAAETASPATVQHCTTARRVRYCLYPDFGSELRALQAPVGAVLAELPRPPAQPLTIRQTATLDFADPTLTHGHPAGQRARWEREIAHGAGTVRSASAIYLTAGSWPAGASDPARFSLALGAAEWAVGLPPTEGTAGGPSSTQCVPLGQARDAVAIWLAIRATGVSGSQPPSSQLPADEVGGRPVVTWTYPGEEASYLASLGPQPTDAGYLLAVAMTRLPVARVSRVLDDAWGTWLSWRTSQARLAAALGIEAPRAPALPGPPPGSAPLLRAPSPVCGP